MVHSFFSRSHFRFYQNSFVIACHEDRELIEVFLGKAIIDERLFFIDRESLNHLSGFFRPVGMLSTPLADTWLGADGTLTVTPSFLVHGLPSGTIRHLHIVRYPYFSDLFCLHGVSYGSLLRTVLYLPATAKPCFPAYYRSRDYVMASAIAKSCNYAGFLSSSSPAFLFNVVNFSHASLSASQISLLISVLEAGGYRVLLNVSQSDGLEELEAAVAARHHDAVFVSVPPELLALVCDSVFAVIGVLGGGMNVAVQFSHSHVLSLQTPAMFMGCSEYELLGEWGNERIWEFYDRDWPCLREERIVQNKWIGDPLALSDEQLRDTMTDFLSLLPSFYTAMDHSSP